MHSPRDPPPRVHLALGFSSTATTGESVFSFFSPSSPGLLVLALLGVGRWYLGHCVIPCFPCCQWLSLAPPPARPMPLFRESSTLFE